jgi:hypothetical protein
MRARRQARVWEGLAEAKKTAKNCALRNYPARTLQCAHINTRAGAPQPFAQLAPKLASLLPVAYKLTRSACVSDTPGGERRFFFF